MNQGGILAAVMVAEGDMIEAGQLIARREQQLSRETLEAGLAASQFELASAQQALTDLYDAVPLQAVQAQIDLANAQDQLNDAEYRWRVQQPGNRASGDIINASEANLILANNQVDKAQKEFNKYSGRADDDPARALALSNLSAARQQRDAILRQLNWYTGQPNNIDQAILDAEVAVAQVQLEEAQVNYDMLQAGPDPELTALAQERIDNALAQVAAAEAALNDLDPDLELLAPFDGTVVELFVNEAEWVSPGQPILVLADLNQLRVETTDLSEIDVAQIAVGDTAAVTFDALANVVTNATIVRISDRAATGSGVNYRVILELDELPPGLRWGMTAFVDIEIDS
jgi:multidrug efflux pump subunit AcrA (membrane-fusion protein)